MSKVLSRLRSGFSSDDESPLPLLHHCNLKTSMKPGNILLLFTFKEKGCSWHN